MESKKITVETVRCKDCVHWTNSRVWSGAKGACEVDSMVRDAEFWCAHNEEKPADGAQEEAQQTEENKEDNA